MITEPHKLPQFLAPLTKLSVHNISKKYGERTVIRNASFTAQSGMVLAITGKNGSGKSTLLKMLAGVLTPTTGGIQYTVEDTIAPDNFCAMCIGFVSPYLALYEEFSPLEHIKHCAAMRASVAPQPDYYNELLAMMNLWERRNDPIKGFSSGMKQRVKYALALLHQPSVLLLDEPMTNLDSQGITIVENLMAIQQQRQTLIVIATNDNRDAALAQATFALDGRM
jgi:heme exporter protein A